MKKKIRVGIIFGGKSAEHEVSLQSAKNVLDAMNKEKYEAVLIGIDKSGRWQVNEESQVLLHADNPKLIQLNKSNQGVALIPGERSEQLLNLTSHKSLGQIDVAFPILHGPFGEDGTVQGLLKLANIPFVGAGVLGSAAGMDKDVMKRLLRDAGIPIAKYVAVDYRTVKDPEASFEKVEEKLGLPLFVKPANLGSSVGVSKASTKEEFDKAVAYALEYDSKVIVEEFIKGQEIECAVLGNSDPVASLPGEILPKRDFYSYEAKYIDEDGAGLEIPAKLPSDIVTQVQQMAIRTFKAICCEGMGRVDCFLKDNGELIVNEINTIPGFTRISMYPKLWEISGISYTELIDRLIELALERFEREQKYKTVVEM
ncbi:D-alanine--D-alanine ligase [Acetonema longum]|uniref:D-alanine--D-alanine ligase n=1 Tax=Acetonema longum DSM 6540 TaxID=1009370 RepID=F7NMD7_9FIRM|nr:D-alanine--D-alanine ligase [Acetonema longum]EGO62813.1 D-alanyl-alanine synthetase A [Acetonema longum DSM 6540]